MLYSFYADGYINLNVPPPCSIDQLGKLGNSGTLGTLVNLAKLCQIVNGGLWQTFQTKNVCQWETSMDFFRQKTPGKSVNLGLNLAKSMGVQITVHQKSPNVPS